MANKYEIEDLLVGKEYRSQSVEGVIQNAEKSDVYFGENFNSYLVRIYTKNSLNDIYRTIAVRVGE